MGRRTDRANPRHNARSLPYTHHPATARYPSVRKRIIGPQQHHGRVDSPWINLVEVASVEVTSEAHVHPIEDALQLDSTSGWVAESPGEQVIRLLFDEPQTIKSIRLVFSEEERARSQEFVLGWSRGLGEPIHEIIRQQFNFAPGGATREREQFAVDLNDAAILELRITPDRDGGDALASLEALRVA